MIEGRPLPFLDDGTGPYWQACARHELRMQRCGQCQHWRFPPRPMCPRCQSMEVELVPVSGRGTVYSFVVVHAPVLPAFQDRLPLPVVLVELDEDPQLRMVGNWLGDPKAMRIGARVAVEFEDVAEDLALPQWRPLSEDNGEAGR